MHQSTNVSLELTQDEALVLFSYLQREIDDNDGNTLRASINHEAEIWALNNLNCVLEKVVSEAFDPNYSARLSAAQGAIIEQCGNWNFEPVSS